MTKKEVKETLKKRQDIATLNREELKVLNVLEDRHSNLDYRIPGQDVIRRSVNMYTSDKAYDIALPRESFRTTYTGNGAHSLIFSNEGFCAAHNTQSLVPLFDIRLEEEIRDAKWLHNEQYFACAQKSAVYVYNGSGSELHAVQSISSPRFLQFLPYHFLLAAYTDKRRLNYLDTSTGKMSTEITLPDSHSKPTVMSQNPQNAVIYVGNTSGTATLWTPSNPTPIITVSCGVGCIGNMAVDREGTKMVVSGDGGRISYFDVRETYKPLNCINVGMPVSKLALSQRNTLSISSNSKLLFFNDFDKCFMKHNSKGKINSLEFCNHEDILAVGHSAGVSYLVVPGSGDPVYDSTETTPFMTSAQRKQVEVKRLLEKIPADLISHDHSLGQLVEQPKSTGSHLKPQSYKRGPSKRTALSRFME
ncbi:U3 small nucleolar RNA-associated protein 7 [Pancytospora epiphaga]|nr:U3 small nucleolar RNA-associated protein 7 [Pancytospora epiphaga]